MKIVFLMKKFQIGGTEFVTSILANAFVSHGHEVCIVSFEPIPVMLQKRLHRDVQCYVMRSRLLSVSAIFELHKKIVNENARIVINQWGLPIWMAILAKVAIFKNHTKLISVYHNDPRANARISAVDVRRSQAQGKLRRMILGLLKTLVVELTSKSMAGAYYLSNHYVLLSPRFIQPFMSFTRISDPKKLSAISNPIEMPEDSWYSKRAEKEKTLIYVGRLDPNQKRVYRVIETWKEIEREFPDWRLNIVGDGPEKNDLLDRIAKYGLKNVHLTGFCEPAEFYKKSSILILTSEYEGFGLVVAEAMAYGVVPVVYGSYESIHDIIEDQVNGYIVQRCAEDDIAKQMGAPLKFLMSNPGLLSRRSQEAIKKSLCFSPAFISAAWLQCFDELNGEN